MADIEIEIDGRKLTAKPNQTVIQVADEAGIYIPRFCYQKHLSIPANCRMCLVEIEKAPKVLPACATPVAPGMKVFTKSQKTLLAQRAVMEFLLINHPLDCPICDQGGECELQDLSMGYGADRSRYNESKRSVADQNLGPLISTEMTRCIYCTRCVRFGDEVAGLRELGAIGRGEFTEISTYIKHAIHSEVSGNIIDLCPVGALTSKPFRFRARAWELDQAPSISAHDCVGSNLNVHSRYGTVMRIVSRENETINGTWISDRDRFSYTALYHADRLEEPMAKIDGQWRTIGWQEAFELISKKLQEIIAQDGADKLGALASPNSTVEEFYLLQKIMRKLNCPHIDHRLREMDSKDAASLPLFPMLDMPVNDLEQCDGFLLIGSNIQKEQPIAGVKVRKASLAGAEIFVVNPVDYRFNFAVKGKSIVAPHRLPETLANIIKSLEAANAGDKESQVLSKQLQSKKKLCILVGALALNHPEAATIRALVQKIAKLCNAQMGFLTNGANSAGGYLAGAIPHRQAGGNAINHVGLSAYDMLEKPRKAYLLLNVEPEFDCANSSLALNAFKQAKFIAALSIYRNAVLEEHADVILPMTPFTETSGSFINVSGDWQSFKGVAKSVKASRPAWKILRVLGNFLHLDGFDYEDSEEVKHEVKALVEKNKPAEPEPYQVDITKLSHKNTLSRIGEVPLYAVDSIVRRASPLQETQKIVEGDLGVVKLHPNTAKRLGLQEKDTVEIRQPSSGAVQLPLILEPRIAEDAAWIAGGIAATVGLGDLMGEVEIKKVN